MSKGRGTTVRPGAVVIADVEGRVTTVRIESSPQSDGEVRFTHLLSGKHQRGRLNPNRAALRSIAIANR